nr:hypothetical protein [Escherichia coli]EFG8473995.1 hypothetical protein [Escherichia coli]EFG9907915.1 hypothetical protein [Escherichia coli]EFJ9452229.1 hypothetical protein [Escherichia coli]
MSQVSLSQQLKEGNLFAEQCPSREVLKHVTSRWGGGDSGGATRRYSSL